MRQLLRLIAACDSERSIGPSVRVHNAGKGPPRSPRSSNGSLMRHGASSPRTAGYRASARLCS